MLCELIAHGSYLANCITVELSGRTGQRTAVHPPSPAEEDDSLWLCTSPSAKTGAS